MLQAYGARRYAMLGVVLQRARLICWCACIPVAVLWNFMGPLLLLLGQVRLCYLICYIMLLFQSVTKHLDACVLVRVRPCGGAVEPHGAAAAAVGAVRIFVVVCCLTMLFLSCVVSVCMLQCMHMLICLHPPGGAVELDGAAAAAAAGPGALYTFLVTFVACNMFWFACWFACIAVAAL